MMGPNGSSKSTLAQCGGPGRLQDLRVASPLPRQNLLEMAPEERAREGIFLAFSIRRGRASTAPTSSSPPSTRSTVSRIRLDAIDFHRRMRQDELVGAKEICGAAGLAPVCRRGKKRGEIFKWRSWNRVWLSSTKPVGLDIDAHRGLRREQAQAAR